VFKHIKRVNPNKVQTLLFSATIPDWLKRLSSEYQDRTRPYINLISSEDIRTSTTISHLCVDVGRFNEDEKCKLVEHVIRKYGG
jgi:ATP-dependent RNA helicase DDX21